MNPEMKIIREVSDQVDDFYGDAVRLGDHAAYALKAIHRAQMTGLENVADNTFKSSDVFDFIKKQTARFSYWRQPFPEHKDTNQGFGLRLMDYLGHDLMARLKTVCDRLGIGDGSIEEKQERRRIYLMLIREFIRKMVAEYEIQSGFVNLKKREA
jgi:hypothetical protein